MANLQLASNLKKYREANGYTQEYVSMRLNISRQAYSNYERGKRNPDIDLLAKLSNLYGITLNQLILIPFSKKTKLIREGNPYIIPAQIGNSENMLFLTQKEAEFLMKYREADNDQKNVIHTILNTK